jgi:NAD(P)-dependent dehydrogenase (short-subunit alcohol dehydrogenase family)
MMATSLPPLGRIALLIGGGIAAAVAARRLVSAAEQDVRGRTVFVTGGSRGLGLLLSKEFARRGARVAICARDRQELDRAAESLERLGAEVVAVACDVSKQPEVDAAIDQVRSRLGEPHILVNNAGIITVGPIQAMTKEDFEEAMGVMFWGTLWPTLAVLPEMTRAGRGTIVNITSIGGKMSVPHLLPYCCAKFAAVALSQGLRAELAHLGIKVTTVVPGLMRTGSHVHARFKGDRTAEYTWFGLSATLPMVSISAERAARQIVRAALRGEAEVILGAPASVAATLVALFPEVSAEALSLVNRMILPDRVPGEKDPVRGADLQQSLSPFLRSLLAS